MHTKTRIKMLALSVDFNNTFLHGTCRSTDLIFRTSRAEMASSIRTENKVILYSKQN